MTDARWFYHPDKPHLQPIETTRPSDQEVEALVREGWRECSRLGYHVRMKRWRQRSEVTA